MQRQSLRQLLSLSLSGVRTYWPAFIGIQGLAVLLVAIYYASPAFQELCTRLSIIKAQGGWMFAAAAGTVSGALIPELLKIKLRPAHLKKPTFAELVHQFAMFAILGVMVERFYHLQSLVFGAGTDWQTLAVKIAFDQCVYTLFIALPFIVIWYLWQENHYNPRATWRACRLPLLRERVLPLFVGNCCFWIPALMALYSLPTQLQFLLSLVIASGWALLLVFMARRQVQENQ